MKSLKIISLFSMVFLLIGVVRADCSFKVVNHSNQTFESMKAKGMIYNLLIPVCTQNPQVEHDPLAKENCQLAPQDILFEHPSSATCSATNGWYLSLQFETSTVLCTSKKSQTTINKHVVLNYPEDFNCESLK